MKIQLIASTCAALVLAAPLGAAAAGTSSSSSGTSSSQRGSSGSSMSSSSRTDQSGDEMKSYRRTNYQALNRQFTALDIIGQRVHDANGAEIGTIVDVALASGFPDQLAKNLAREESGSTTARGEKRSDSQASTGSAAQSAQSRGSSAAESGQREKPTPAVFISLNSVSALGADLVRVPVEKLKYDDSNRRLTLNVQRNELATYAGSGDMDYDWFVVTEYIVPVTTTTAASDRSSSTSSGTSSSTSAKETWQSDAELIRSALRSDSTLSGVASQIKIDHRNDALVLSGTVDTEAQKDRAMQLAKQHSDQDVRDELKVKK